MSLICIWAESKNGIIGRNNTLPWRIPEELKHFKQTTIGHRIVMGYNTFKSFKRLLPGRTTVLLRSPHHKLEFSDVVCQLTADEVKHFEIATFEEVLELSKTEDIYIVGGKKTYEMFIRYSDVIIRTIIDIEVNGDTSAPTFDKKLWTMVSKKEGLRQPSGPTWSVEVWKQNRRGENMFNELKAKERVVKLGELPEAIALNRYIQELDVKYNVNSKDPDNTFGDVDLDKAIITHGVNNTLYFAGISKYGNDKFPTHTQIPLAESLIAISEHGNVALLENAKRIRAEIVPITIEQPDIERLDTLRKRFAEAVQKHAPKTPKFEKYLMDLVSKEHYGINYQSAHRWQKDDINDFILKEQGFAGSNHQFKETFMVPNVDGELREFVVRYEVVGGNNSPHFSTTYCGWQNQDEMDENHPCTKFYEKWNIFHLCALTIEEMDELRTDIKLLKEWYNKNE